MKSAAVAIALVASTLALPTSAATTGQGPGGQASAVTARHKVTLVTGDVIQLETLSDGTQTATATPRPNVTFVSRRVDNETYVVPSDANPLLAAGRIDIELFNVSRLVRDGYDDARSSTLPLIIQYVANMKADRKPIAGTTKRFSLESINADSVREAKTQARTFWSSITPAVRKIWLNQRVRTTLTESVPQVGAPQAWQSGYDGSGITVAVLDTGIDAKHPDLDGGKVTAAGNFTSDPDTDDHFGHGTHVASIVAGTGEGAAAARKGVAPGASLINAKVLDRNGSGTLDGVIEGLEWAAAQGADVANMSLGTSAPSDGSDPLTQAVDRVSKESGMLVVIAAGNMGPGSQTIASPGWADEALTVGAVDKQDALAGFSSRGPRLGDFGIKPDISAPGVAIVAARAAGTSLGPIVDDVYQQLSGTSMATPHVAGAAAILAQRHPGYTNKQLKDALISTAKTNEAQSVYEQGGGRLDVARAVAQPVRAEPGTLNLGFFPYPHTGQTPVTKPVTYVNDSSAEVTLDLSLTVSGKDSGPAPDGMFSVSQQSVTVPAGGSASVNVTVDPSAGSLDLYGGYLVASSGDTVVHTSVGAYIEPERFNLTVSGIARDGRPAKVLSLVELWSLDTGSLDVKYFGADVSTVTFRVPRGTYNVGGYIGTADAANIYAREMTAVIEPEVEMTADRAITLDARTATPLAVNTPQPTAPQTLALSYHRGHGGRSLHSMFIISSPVDRGFATSTAAVTKGDFEFYSKWELVAPRLQAQVTRPSRIPLDPQPMTNAVPVDGRHTLPLVYAGFGKPEDYVGRDVRGKIALVSRGGEVTFAAKVANATRAGAWAVIIFNNQPGLLLATAGNPGEVSIRGYTIEQEAGHMLLDLLQQGPVRVQVSGTVVSPFTYDVLLPEPDRVPETLTYTVNRTNTAEINTTYAADVAGTHGADVHHISRPWPTFSFAFIRDVPRPLNRTYYVSANDTEWWHLAWANFPFDGEFHSAWTRYEPRTTLSENWFGRVSRPGATALLDETATRTGDGFTMALVPYSDSGGHHGWGLATDVHNTKLYAGGTLLADRAEIPFGEFPAVAGPATYRLIHNGSRTAPWWKYSTETNTTWTFKSSRPPAGQEEKLPLLQVDYQLSLDAMNQALDRSVYTFGLGAGYLPGHSGPGVRTVQAWASFNDGGTWRRVDLVATGNGWQATVRQPAMANTTGAVSLRVRATDAAGNSVDQTLIRAYGLKASP